MEPINLTEPQLALRFRIEVSKFNDKHFKNMLNEVLAHENYGTERCDLMVNSMMPHTTEDYETVCAILHLELLKEAAFRLRKLL